MGIEAAKELITKKIKSAALEEKEHYTEEETAKICGELIKEGGLIRIVAQNFVLQLERKRSEEQALLLDNIETQIWYLTDTETYGIVNKAHAAFLGMEKEKLEGRVLYDVISVEEAEVCIANNREVFEKKKQSHTEERVKNGRGETRLLSITRTPKLDGEGDVEYVICAAEDITELKKAEERIEHLNSVLKAIRKVNQLIIVEKDRDSLLQKACNALVDARGYDAAWLGFLSDGKNFATVVGSGFGEDVARFCEHVMGGDHPPCIRNALAHKDPFMVVDRSRVCGDCFFKSACAGNEAAIIRVEHANKFFGLLAILFAPDVTVDEEEKELLDEVAGDTSFALHDMEVEEARKQAEEKLRNAEADWRNSFNSLDDVMLIINRDYNIENINEIGLKLLGKSKEEVIGKKCYQVISGADSPGEDCPCTKSLETKKVESCDRYEERFGKYGFKEGHHRAEAGGEAHRTPEQRPQSHPKSQSTHHHGEGPQQVAPGRLRQPHRNSRLL
jgi:PAS domain S-box-containing protein